MRNCTRDEGGPFEIGDQALISSHRELLSSKAMVVSVAETAGQIPSGKVERGERKQTADDVSKTDQAMPKPGVAIPLGSARGMPETAQAASGMEAARSSTRLSYGT